MATMSGIAPMTYAAFTSIPNGTQVKNYNYDQCVAVANLYHQGVLGLPLPSGFTAAHQWRTEFGRQPNLYNRYRQSQTPVAGALFVARGGIYNAADGHIGVVTAVHPDGSFDTIEQNAERWRYLGRYRRTRTAGILGFLIPNDNPASSTPSGQEEDDTMATAIGHYIGGSASTPADKRNCVIYYPESGFYTTWSGAPQSYHNSMAQSHRTGNFTNITEKHWEQTIKPQLDKLLAR